MSSDPEHGSIPARAGKPSIPSPSEPGSIPARAGKPARSTSRRAPWAGLSPPVRGSRSESGNGSCARRVYPRPCGEAPRTHVIGTRTVYPRPCGEAHARTPWSACIRRGGLSPPVRGSPGGVGHRPCGESAALARGLSPPVRGSPASTQVGRSIPARAGKPALSRLDFHNGLCRHGLGSPSCEVYPRPCGEARIRQRLRTIRHGRMGSIPARAGKPELPRSPEDQGSIPARAGKPAGGAAPSTDRSIPARAGNPRSGSPVYPRPCGEASCYMEDGQDQLGAKMRDSRCVAARMATPLAPPPVPAS